MAHPCFHCGGECYCSGSWDDVIVDKTPITCESCGCFQEAEERRDFENEYDDDDDWYDQFEESQP